jgi:hypothetical protein
MAKNIIRKEHPIQYEIIRFKRRCAENAENIRFIGKLLALMSLPFLGLYTAKKIPTVIEYIKEQQAINRENAIWRFENMPAKERDKIWTKEQQDAIFDHIDNLRAKERY